jgi:pimeloyl-ACP methyl ester carboxylesterase
MWKPQFELADEFHVVAPDLPGFGGSPVRSDPMTMRGFAEATIELLDLLDIESAVIASLSMGGLVAMELGLGYPERVDGLVLAATTAEPTSHGEVQERYAKAALLQERGMLPLAGEMISDLFGPRASRDRALAQRIFTMMLCAPPDGAAAALRGRAARPDYSTLLRGLSVPSLVIAGDHDAHASTAVVRQLVNALPEVELARFVDSGHMPNLEEPERFNYVLRDFARKHSGTAGK